MASQRVLKLFAAFATCFVFGAAAQADGAKPSGVHIDADLTRQITGLRPSDGYLADWYIAGPIAASAEQIQDSVSKGVSESFPVKLGATTYDWRPALLKKDETNLDLRKRLATDSKAVAFAYSEVYVNRDTPALLKIFADEKVTCWINGEQVVLKKKSTTSNERMAQGTARLRMGFNDILFLTHSESKKWTLGVQVLQENGQMIDPRRLWILDDARFNTVEPFRFEPKFR